jgi:hypothetical protein
MRFPYGARQTFTHGFYYVCRAFFAPTHGKDPIFAVRFFLAHGKGRHTTFHPGAVRCFFLPCAVKKRTAKIIYRALSDAAHGKGALPCKMLPCALCRGPTKNTRQRVSRAF